MRRSTRPIVIKEEFTVYVHTFGGYAMKDAVNIREGKKFARVLEKAGKEVTLSLVTSRHIPWVRTLSRSFTRMGKRLSF